MEDSLSYLDNLLLLTGYIYFSGKAPMPAPILGDLGT